MPEEKTATDNKWVKSNLITPEEENRETREGPGGE